MTVHDLGFQALKILPPEFAHGVAARALKAGMGPKARASTEGSVLFGKRVANRFGLSGGADKTGTAIAGWRDAGLGFEEAGTVTPLARAGNAGTRIWRMADGRSLVNWMGLPNPGISAFAANVEAFRSSRGGTDHCVGASLADPANDPANLVAMARRLEGLVDFVTVNLSCPNVADHDATWGAALAQVEALARAANVPVLAKLGPSGDDDVLAKWAIALRDAGAAGNVVCNTVPYALRHLVPMPPRNWPERDGVPVGGFSGPGLLPISLRMTRTIRDALGQKAVVIGRGACARRSTRSPCWRPAPTRSRPIRPW